MKQATSPDSGSLSDQHQISYAIGFEGEENCMECSPSHSVTIVDDDSGICEIIEKMLSSWNFIPYVLPEPFSLTELLKNSVSTDIFLLDVCLPTEMTLDWIPTIMDNFPETKVIIMTGYADTDTVIKAIRNGAFDFLQKPLSFELMNHSLLRAIQLQERDRQMKQMLADLRHNHALLLDQKQKLEFMNERLLDTNRAFSTLAQNLDFERTEILNRITQKIESGVIPALAKIRSDTRLAQYSIEIDVIINMIQDIVFDSCPIDLLSATLTTAEARVASLIKRGLTSDMIAEHLFVSVDTVKTHRRNIRKKLNITNCQDSLRDFLLKKPMSATS